jgi:hypothetical protein
VISRRIVARLVGVLGLGGVAWATGCADDGGPRLHAVTPPAAGAGAVVTLDGRGLCGERGDCATAAGAIRIGLDMPVQANVLMYTNTSAQVRIPSITPVGRTAFVVTVNERASNALDFEVLAP